jgi:hypothetical protein
MSHTNLINKIKPFSMKCDIQIDKQWVYIDKNHLTSEIKLLNETNCICGRKIKHTTLVFNPRTNVAFSVGGKCFTYFKLLQNRINIKKTICVYCKKTNSKGFHKSCFKKSKYAKKILYILRNVRRKLRKLDINIEPKSDVIIEQKSDVIIEQKSDVIIEQKSDVIIEQKSDIIIEQKSDIIIEQKSDIIIEQKSDIIIEQKSDVNLYIHNFKRETINPPEFLTDEQKLCYKIFYRIIQNTKYEYGKTLDTQFISTISDLILNKLNFFKKIKQFPISLKGGAGTGKTTISTYLIQNAMTEDDNLCVLAPTHKALANIRSSFRSICTDKNLIIKYSTISKFLNAKVQYDKDGKQFYEISPDITVPYSHIIIDEMSMINKKDFEAIENIMKYNRHILFIFLGDDCQLPPIGESESISFTKVNNMYELKNIVRAGNDDLKNIYSFFRNKVKTNSRKFLPSRINSMENVKYLTNMDDIKNVLGGRFDFKSDVVLAFRNKTVDSYQNYIRNIYGFSKDEYGVGEKMIFKSFMKLPLQYNKTYYQDFIDSLMILNYNKLSKAYDDMMYWDMIERRQKNKSFNKVDICFVKSSKECDFLGYKVNSINVSLEGEESIYNFNKVKEYDIDRFTKDCKIWWGRLKTLIKMNNPSKRTITNLWEIYYLIINLIDAPLIFGYSSTIHKSQGSTYRNIFLDINDCSCISRNLSDYNKLLYTAVTRSKDMLYILDCNDNLD